MDSSSFSWHPRARLHAKMFCMCSKFAWALCVSLACTGCLALCQGFNTLLQQLCAFCCPRCVWQARCCCGCFCTHLACIQNRFGPLCVIGVIGCLALCHGSYTLLQLLFCTLLLALSVASSLLQCKFCFHAMCSRVAANICYVIEGYVPCALNLPQGPCLRACQQGLSGGGSLRASSWWLCGGMLSLCVPTHWFPPLQ